MALPNFGIGFAHCIKPGTLLTFVDLLSAYHDYTAVYTEGSLDEGSTGGAFVYEHQLRGLFK